MSFDQAFVDEMRACLRHVSQALNNADPFARFVPFDGRLIPRAQARAIERALWPMAYPKVGKPAGRGG